MNSSSSILWLDGPAQPSLRPGEVHLWRARLDEPPPPGWHGFLASAEWVRAERFHFPRDRDRFTASRAILRGLLARYLECDPASLEFCTGPHGKPELRAPASLLRFNISHSGDWLLIAITHAREVGVDIEQMRPEVPFEMLAEHFFEPEDAWEIRLLPPGQKPGRFYRVWTSTEACLKASGAGFAHGNRVLEPDRWALRRLEPAEGYAGALAVEGDDFDLACWTWAQ